jgi:hypothetical protein
VVLGFLTLFASDGRPADFQVSQTHTQVWDLVFCIIFTRSCWFFYADFAGCRIARRCTSCTCHFLEPSVICWSSRKQSLVAQSITEAKYASCCSQILWIVHAMRDFGVRFEIVPLMCDNTSAISIAKNPVFHKRMRHLGSRHHFLRDHVEK